MEHSSQESLAGAVCLMFIMKYNLFYLYLQARSFRKNVPVKAFPAFLSTVSGIIVFFYSVKLTGNSTWWCENSLGKPRWPDWVLKKDSGVPLKIWAVLFPMHGKQYAPEAPWNSGVLFKSKYKFDLFLSVLVLMIKPFMSINIVILICNIVDYIYNID